MRVGAIPGVQSAGAINWLPIVNRERPVRFLIDGRPAPSPGEEAWAGLANVTPAYRRTMEIPLAGGRDLTPDDTADERPVALISREAARRYWGAADPIGRHIRFLGQNGEPGTGNREPEIVGVVGDVWTGNRDAPVIPMIYVPQTQAPQRAMALVVRAPGDAATLANAIRNRVLEIDKDQPVYDVKTMDRYLYEDRADTYIVVTMLVALAGIALGLAAAGLYGVVAYMVGQRTHEIGVRMALGAESGVVQRMIVAQALVPVVIGAAAGLAMGFGLVQTTAAAMREVSPRSPAVYLAVSAVVGMVALAASYFPARRATRVDPLLALRAE
jgi:putative ABC transport system permease protein